MTFNSNGFHSKAIVCNSNSSLKPDFNDDSRFVEDLLHDYETSFCSYMNVHIFATTFNVNGRPPPERLHDWLNLNTVELPDLIVIGLQEITLELGAYMNSKGDELRRDLWISAIQKNLPNIYTFVENICLIGIFMTVYRRNDSPLRLSNICTNTKATGFLGQFGNKGGVDSTVCFVNSHLAAGNNELSRRNQDFHCISQMFFNNGLGIYDHDVVIWLGDLNYRLETSHSYEQVILQVEANNFVDLLKYDQLRIQKETKTAFNGFHESRIDFRPTYKFDVGTQKWDTSEKRRIPAWCDRILYWIRDKNVKIKQLEYGSVQKVVFSDHKPVCGVFSLTAKTIDLGKQAEVYEKILRESDKRSNDLLPQIRLSCSEINFGEISYRKPSIRMMKITNIGLTATNFRFIPSFHSNECSKNWLTITPESSFLEVRATSELFLQAAVDDEEACGIDSNNDIVELSCIMILHLDGGRDYFITVTAKYNRTRLREEAKEGVLITI